MRGCSPSAHAFMFSEFIFNRAFLFHTFLSLFSFALSPSKPLRRRRDGSEKKFSAERERDFDPPTAVGFFPRESPRVLNRKTPFRLLRVGYRGGVQSK